MANLQVSEMHDYFTDRETGKKFFYLADTVWAAFSNATIEEWKEYLDYRKMQGFNAIQISILPILHDMSESCLNIFPFQLRSDGRFDYSQINGEYFRGARLMVEMAVQRGFVPALAVLWCCYVPGTRVTTIPPENNDLFLNQVFPQYVMPMDAVEMYIKYITCLFSEFSPVYLVSGDTDEGNEETWMYFKKAARMIKSIHPEALITMHMTPKTDLPSDLANGHYIDFYMYQSGHRIEEYKGFPYLLAQKFYNKPVKRPIVNGEPCYEGHGHINSGYRYNAFEVRKALWQSLLSGAKAGFAYGAHGLWGWHRKGFHFNRAQHSGMPFDWRTAMRMEGAWDAAFAKYIFENYQLFDIEPQEEILEGASPEIRISASADFSKIAVYIPYCTDVKIKKDLSGYQWSMIVLSDKLFASPDISIHEGISTIKMHEFNSDVLIIGTR